MLTQQTHSVRNKTSRPRLPWEGCLSAPPIDSWGGSFAVRMQDSTNQNNSLAILYTPVAAGLKRPIPAPHPCGKQGKYIFLVNLKWTIITYFKYVRFKCVSVIYNIYVILCGINSLSVISAHIWLSQQKSLWCSIASQCWHKKYTREWHSYVNLANQRI